MTSLAAGAVLPDFALKNTSGGTLRLSEYQKGGPALVAFWKHECPTCQLAVPYLERIYRRCRGERLRFLGVAQDAKEDAVAFAKEKAIMMPFVLEESPWPAAEACGLTNVPTVFLVDGERKCLAVQVGFSRKAYQEISDRVAGLAGKPPEALFDFSDRAPESKPG